MCHTSRPPQPPFLPSQVIFVQAALIKKALILLKRNAFVASDPNAVLF